MKLQELIDSLENKRADIGNVELEFLVCTADEGILIAAVVDKQAKAMKSALKLFGDLR